jgi:hypothetical protein
LALPSCTPTSILTQGDYSLVFWELFSLNCILPGRLGELARPVLVAQKTKTSFPGAVSSVLLKRLFDLFTLLVLFSFLIAWIPIPESLSYTFGKYEFNSALLISLSWWMIKLFCLLLGAVLLLAFKRTRKVFAIIISAALKYVCIFPEKIADILKRFLLNPLTMFTMFIHYFVTGIEAIQTPMAFISVMGLSFGTWFVQALSFLMVARGCPRHFPWVCGNGLCDGCYLFFYCHPFCSWILGGVGSWWDVCHAGV